MKIWKKIKCLSVLLPLFLFGCATADRAQMADVASTYWRVPRRV